MQKTERLQARHYTENTNYKMIAQLHPTACITLKVMWIIILWVQNDNKTVVHCGLQKYGIIFFNCNQAEKKFAIINQ